MMPISDKTLARIEAAQREIIIAKDQPRALWNSRCHYNAWQVEKYEGLPMVAVISYGISGRNVCAHFVNRLSTGEALDVTCGVASHYCRYFIVDEPWLWPWRNLDERLCNLKRFIQNTYGTRWQRIKALRRWLA